MKLFNRIKKLLYKEEKPEDTSCDLDSILSMECVIVNPTLIKQVENILSQVSSMYSKTLINQRFNKTGITLDPSFKYNNYATTDKIRMLQIFEHDLKNALEVFCEAHHINANIEISTNWKEIEKFENENIANIFHIQGLEK